MIIVYVNCSKYPFIQWIMDRKKVYETRNRKTLNNIIGKTVYLAETGKKGKAVIRCRCVISDSLTVTDIKTYNEYRPLTMIVPESVYDFKPGTKQKILYKLSNVRKVKPFTVPDNIVRHGRIWAETV